MALPLPTRICNYVKANICLPLSIGDNRTTTYQIHSAVEASQDSKPFKQHEREQHWMKATGFNAVGTTRGNNHEEKATLSLQF
jgi:hypothetical protein